MDLPTEEGCVTKREIFDLCKNNPQIEIVNDMQIRIIDFNHTIYFPKQLGLDYLINCINSEIRRGNNKPWNYKVVEEIVK